jgi:hypothetical protein
MDEFRTGLCDLAGKIFQHIWPFQKKVFVYDLDFWVCSHLFTEKAKNLREQYWA